MSVPDETVQSVNPLLVGGRIPGSTFQLPSRGIFYQDGELALDVSEGEVHVFPMTAYDEILIKTPDLLFSGEAIKQIFQRCIPSVLKPLRLLAKDVDFLLICLRSVSFGDVVSVLHTHTCKDAKEHKYEVTIQEFMRKTKSIDPTVYSSEYQVPMPDDKICYLNPLRYDAIVNMMVTAMEDKDEVTTEEIHTEMIGRLAGLISRVVIPKQTNGNAEDIHVTDFKQIQEWIGTVTIPHMKVLNEAIEKISEWGTDTSFNIGCLDCKEELEITAPLNPMSFFT